mgnify:CR=1 FL=1
MEQQARARLAVDIGGTFTDVVLERPGLPRVTAKLLTTHAHPGEAVLEGIGAVLAEAELAPAAVGLIIHGTTLATNALIERRGAVTALLTTAGHRDVLAMAHEDRFEQYDVMIDRPRPLVPRHLRLPVTERLDRDGRVRVPLEAASLEAALPVLDEYGVESVAIGYLHAFVNPEHEQRTADWLAQRRPGLSITLASEVCPEIREYERLSTACANAYVRPLMARYLERLSGELHELGFRCPFLMMTSGGGLTTLRTAAKFPIRLVESGPAGGAILAQAVAQQAGMPRVLSFDMGGTTAKLALVDDFEPLTSRSFEVDRVYRFKKGSGLPVRIPVIEMVEIGAGGGSIAAVDKLGRIQVGPESSGSEPGPAAYGRGGERPAVTDADVLLGRVVPDTFAGGAFVLDAEAARSVIGRAVAEPLGMLDCSPISDGGAALVLTTLERARELADAPVVITGSAQASDTLALHDRWSFTSQRATRTAADRALAQSGRSIEDMDLMEVNDGFTIGEIIALEDLGLVEPGQGGRLAEEGVTALGGETPVNTSGGLKARGNPPGATGIAQVVEVYDQLLGRAEGRQVEGARSGLAQNVGGTGATVTVHVMEVA